MVGRMGFLGFTKTWFQIMAPLFLLYGLKKLLNTENLNFFICNVGLLPSFIVLPWD